MDKSGQTFTIQQPEKFLTILEGIVTPIPSFQSDLGKKNEWFLIRNLDLTENSDGEKNHVVPMPLTVTAGGHK